MSRLVDAVALVALVAVVALLTTRIGFVFGPDACWTTC